MPQYPTQIEIFTKKINFKKETIEKIKTWKKEEWKKTQTKRHKQIALTNLILILNKIYSKEVSITFHGKTCNYNPRTNVININNSMSIISTLHEFAHAIKGRSELQACRWSIQLFKKTFVNAYVKLNWHGHLLTNKKENKFMPNPTTEPTLSTKVKDLRVKARNILRMKWIEKVLESINLLETKITNYTKLTEESKKYLTTRKYELAKLDTEHPDYKETKERNSQRLKEIQEVTDEQLKTYAKKTEETQELIQTKQTLITNIESGEKKVSLEELNEMTNTLIDNLAK